MQTSAPKCASDLLRAAAAQRKKPFNLVVGRGCVISNAPLPLRLLRLHLGVLAAPLALSPLSIRKGGLPRRPLAAMI